LYLARLLATGLLCALLHLAQLVSLVFALVLLLAVAQLLCTSTYHLRPLAWFLRPLGLAALLLVYLAAVLSVLVRGLASALLRHLLLVFPFLVLLHCSRVPLATLATSLCL
jgi:hypothetical protein